jgi:enoyl-[acyl-carrier protein] reductase I
MLLEGKHGLILGIANKRSIAWGIAQAVSREGARLAVTYQGERLEENVRELAQGLNEPVILPCDVSKDLDTLAGEVQKSLGGLDFVVHAVAFALREELDGEFMNTSREGYRVAQDISSYSLTAVTKRMVPLMEGRGGGSVVTLTYLGGERVVPHYNVMGVAKAALEMSVRYLANDLGPKGIRVNAISAGPIKTLAASGVHGISKMLEYHRTHAPLRKNTEQEEVGDVGLFLVSSLSRGVTGEVIHVDNGFHVMGMAAL